jgi:hypothetical protein
MNRLLKYAAIMIIPLAILFVSARLTSGVSPAAAGAVVVPVMGSELAPSAAEDTAIFAGGCFWGR